MVLVLKNSIPYKIPKNNEMGMLSIIIRLQRLSVENVEMK